MTSRRSRFIRFNVVLGLSLVAIGLLANPWLLAYFLHMGGSSLLAKIFVGAFDVFLITSGLLVYLKGNTREGRKRLAFGFSALLLVVLIIEGGLRIVDLAVHRDDQQSTVDERTLLSPYAGKEWAEDYWKEYHEFVLTSDYEPFLGWDYGEYHGDYIDTGPEGVRKSWNPEHDDGEAPGTTYVFGGSTTWGVGARDNYTIPSYLSRRLNDNGYAFYLYNYGALAYTFEQEIIHLILLLREGHRPDYVIFYDGANEVWASYVSGIPGSPMNLSIMREKLRESWSMKDALRLIANKAYDFLTSQSLIYRAINSVLTHLSSQQQFQEVVLKYDDEELQLLSSGIAEQYLESKELLDHLAQAYGFEYVCFWQPVTYTETRFTDEEAESDRIIKDRALSDLYRFTRDALVAASPPHFFNISDVLGNRTKTLYIDSAHLSEEGNEVVANKIFQIFEREFLRE